MPKQPKYKSADELQAQVDKYFADAKVCSMPGLAYSLGFASRQSLYDYELRSEPYAYVIKRARLRIESFHAERGNVIDIFALKQLGWSDRQEHTGPAGGPIQVDGKIEIMLTTSDRKI